MFSDDLARIGPAIRGSPVFDADAF